MYVVDGNRSALQRRTNSPRLAAMPRFMARANPASNPISITVMRERVSPPNVDSSHAGTSWSGSLFKTMISVSGATGLRNVGRDFARSCMSRYVGMRTLTDGGTLRPWQRSVSRFGWSIYPPRRGKASARAPKRLRLALGARAEAGSTSAVDIASRQRDSHRLRLLRGVMDRRVLEIIGVVRFAVLGQVRQPRLAPLPPTRRWSCG